MIGILGFLFICILLAFFSAVSNFVLPSQSKVTDLLSNGDKIRLEEAFHLRDALGDAIWPGWSQTDIPAILYNEEYAFLVGYPNPPSGWIQVPSNVARGDPWELVPQDDFYGQPYYRQRLADPGVTPQSFVVLVGDQWVSSLTTREWMEIKLGNQFKQELPPIIQSVFPYRLIGRLFLSATGSKDGYIIGLVHESFHAYQGIQAPGRLISAENLYNQNIHRYPSDDSEFRRAWQTELDLLSDAIQAKSDAEAIELVKRFLAQRRMRRETFRLDSTLIEMERQKEWEEGLAKYTEQTIWRLAATTPGYTPLPDMADDSGFKKYTNYSRRWSDEVKQIRRVAGDTGDLRFYYSGFAQAALLDRLGADWHSRILADGVYLEDLLMQVIE